MDRIGDYEVHPAANLFPMMDDDAFEALKADIKANGQLEYGTLFEGKILDGRNRFRACLELGIDPQFCEIDDDEEPSRFLCDRDRIEWENRKRFDPVAHVLSVNLHRRHLTTSQRAAIAVEVEKLYAGKPGRKKNGGKIATNSPDAGKARDKAAKALNVSPRSVQDAKTVEQYGSPELVAAVKSGEVAVSKAARIAKASPPEIQMDEVADAKARKPKAASVTRKLQIGDADPLAECTQPQRSKVVSAEAEALNALQHSRLVKLSVNNPGRRYAFDHVIAWLETQRDNPTGYAKAGHNDAQEKTAPADIGAAS